MRKLESIATIRMGHTFRESLNNDTSGHIAVVQVKDFAEWNPDNFVRGQFDNIKTPRLKHDDILVSARGTLRARIFGEASLEAITTSSVFIVRPESSYIPEFIEFYLNSARGQHILRRASQGSSIPWLSNREFGSILIPDITLDEQRQLMQAIQTIKHSKEALISKQRLLTKLEQGLLQEATNDRL